MKPNINRIKHYVPIFWASFLTLSFACTNNSPTPSTNRSNSNSTVEHSGVETQTSESEPKETKDKFDLLSIEPYPSVNQLEEAKERFHEYVVLGKTKITDERSRKILLDALKKGIRDAKKAGRSQAACFEPRHGMHFIKQGHATDYLICFGCWRVVKYVDNEIQDEPGMVNDYPGLIFDKFLIEAGIPLAKKIPSKSD